MSYTFASMDEFYQKRADSKKRQKELEKELRQEDEKKKYECKIRNEINSAVAFREVGYESSHVPIESMREMFINQNPIGNQTVTEFFNTLGIDLLYQDEAVKQFKRNQNKMKQKLIEENAKLKKQMETHLKESRQLLNSWIEEFNAKLFESKKMLDDAAIEFKNECKKTIKNNFKTSDVKKVFAKAEEKMKSECEIILKEEEKIYEDLKVELKNSLLKSRIDCKNRGKQYKETLTRMYNKEKDMIQQTIDSAQDMCIAAENTIQRVENNCEGMVNEIVTRRLESAESRFAFQLAKVLHTLKFVKTRSEVTEVLKDKDNIFAAEPGEMCLYDLNNYVKNREDFIST